jgi:hypothetical protein
MKLFNGADGVHGLPNPATSNQKKTPGSQLLFILCPCGLAPDNDCGKAFTNQEQLYMPLLITSAKKICFPPARAVLRLAILHT